MFEFFFQGNVLVKKMKEMKQEVNLETLTSEMIAKTRSERNDKHQNNQIQDGKSKMEIEGGNPRWRSKVGVQGGCLRWNFKMDIQDGSP